ncbi:hypothetical protein [Paenibacillus sp. 598K]|uniref:hypothetical protein n=1 Tax=Paenibacillus sp. 598K TaxID=1117987 RepID=UPI000FFE46BC|nr:hypothetical protein [Paenibacillus sp. 598K]
MTGAINTEGRLIHTLPLLLRQESMSVDLAMTENCLRSLALSPERSVIIYNQGCLANEDLQQLTSQWGVDAHILGDGHNIGIAQARQACFEYIWRELPQTAWTSEIHVDMIFPAHWYAPLLRYLETSQEPMISPGIVTAGGVMQPLEEQITVPADMEGWLELLPTLSREGVVYGFVHPVIHHNEALRAIGGYDIRLLKGKQGFEDDSLLVGYSYYIGTRQRWRPQICLQSWVYHATLAQRMSMPDKLDDFARNEVGLVAQYGIQGLRELARVHDRPATFLGLAQKYMSSQKGLDA